MWPGCRSRIAPGDPADYDLRRLKRKGLITRIPGRHRYQVTPLGRRVAVLFTKIYGRVLTPGLTALDPRLPEQLSTRSELATRLETPRSQPRPVHRRRARRCMIVQLGLTVNHEAAKQSGSTQRTWDGGF
jgi:hypothetical protein